MWSHYAGQHTRVCIGFKPSRIKTNFLSPVNYSQIVPVVDVRAYTSNDSFAIVSAGLTKSEHWDYEEELIALDEALNQLAAEAPSRQNLSNSAISSVYLWKRRSPRSNHP